MFRDQDITRVVRSLALMSMDDVKSCIVQACVNGYLFMGGVYILIYTV